MGNVEHGANDEPLCLENLMTQQAKGQQRKPGSAHPSPVEDVNKLKQEAEAKEVASRHKNSGQKDHKGAR